MIQIPHASSRRYLVKTLGCKANLYDSQLIESELQKRGWIAASSGADAGLSLCIVNSCTVTDEADRQSRKLAARMARDNPGARVVVTGCAAEVDPERMAASRGIHYVVGNRDKPKMIDLILEALAKDGAPGVLADGEAGSPGPARTLGVAEGYAEMISRHPIDREWPLAEASLTLPATNLVGESGRRRAFLKIQDGCNSFCTYCVIPYGRGPSRSLPIAEVVSQVRRLTEEGIREVVLTGINLGDYGTDWDERPQIVALIEAVLADTRLERLRVSSLDPVEIEPGMIELMKNEPRFCPHFHVSLQSPHSRVLRLMKRKYGSEQVAETLARIAEIPAPPGGVFVGMDVITGFPGESETDFDWGVQALAHMPWSRLHVFPYSERAGTPATRLPGTVPPAERARRAKILRDLSFSRLLSVYERALSDCASGSGKLETVLVENRVRAPSGALSGTGQDGMEWWSGYSSNYLRVVFAAPESAGHTGDEADWLANQIVSVEPQSLLPDPIAGDVALGARFLSVR